MTVPSSTEATICIPVYGASSSQITLTMDAVVTHSWVDGSGVRKGAYMCLDNVKDGISQIELVVAC